MRCYSWLRDIYALKRFVSKHLLPIWTKQGNKEEDYRRHKQCLDLRLFQTTTPELGILILRPSNLRNQLLRFRESSLDEAVHVIGIYGMSGVGKTTTADKVAAQAKNDCIFDEIVKVVVTQNSVVGKFKMNSQLYLKLNETTEVGKAIHLLQRLTNWNKILLILDDVWKEHDLSDIGIPFANENTNGCKIVLTSRRENVCQEMKVDKKITIDFLSSKEAYLRDCIGSISPGVILYRK